MASHLLRTALAVPVLMLLLSASATVIEYRVPVTKQLFACATKGVLRVATQTLLQPCCTGKLKCAQFLATAGVLCLIHTTHAPSWRHQLSLVHKCVIVSFIQLKGLRQRTVIHTSATMQVYQWLEIGLAHSLHPL